MKKVIALILALALCIGAVACSSDNKEENTNPTGAATNDTNTTKDDNTTGTPDATTPAPDVTADLNGTHIVTDHAGNQIEVPNKVERVVVADIYPMASVLTVFFDSADKIVGMAPPCMSTSIWLPA